MNFGRATLIAYIHRPHTASTEISLPSSSPMRVAIVSDVHSNLEALTTALNRIRAENADEIWCLGDVVGYGPSPNECIGLVRENCSVVLKGNHEAGAIGEIDLSDFNEDGHIAIEWTQRRLSDENDNYLRSLPLSAFREGIMLAHATPADPESWNYVLTWADVSAAFETFSGPVCFIGHTHIPMILGEDQHIGSFRKGVRHLVNVGSIGQPRDGNPLASFGLYDTTSGEYQNIRVEYDVEKVMEAMNEAGLPEDLGKRLRLGI